MTEPKAPARSTPSRSTPTRSTMEKTYDSATKALNKSRASALETARKTADGIETNPMSLLAGGIAIGAVIGAVIPRFDRERDLLEPVGKRIAGTASAAAKAARDAGKAELDSLGLNKNAARDQAGKLLGGVIKALATAGTAAASAAKTKE